MVRYHIVCVRFMIIFSVRKYSLKCFYKPFTDPKSGHVKGAVSTPFPLTFVDQSSGTLKSRDQLKAGNVLLWIDNHFSIKMFVFI